MGDIREPLIKSLAVALGLAGRQARRGERSVVIPHKRVRNKACRPADPSPFGLGREGAARFVAPLAKGTHPWLRDGALRSTPSGPNASRDGLNQRFLNVDLLKLPPWDS